MLFYLLLWNTENKQYSLKPTIETAVTHSERVLTQRTRGHNDTLGKVCEHDFVPCLGKRSANLHTTHHLNEWIFILILRKFVNPYLLCREYMTTDVKIFQTGIHLIHSCIYLHFAKRWPIYLFYREQDKSDIFP